MGPQRGLFEPLRRLDPERIGSYVLLGRLGAGAMGRVYLGRSAAGRLVAVKTIKAEFAEEDDFRARFAHEVAAARRVSGVFTAAVVAADPDADVPWLATAYVPAPSLDRMVRTCGPLPVSAIRWLAAGCAEALESIHGVGLVHRDLKPSNVLVSPDGPKVIDFGVARAAERIHLTSTHGSVGTPAYMAPEQARDTRMAAAASDVFSLGSTLLFAASGHAPYHGETAMDILVRLATEPPDLSGLPTELAGIVTSCLARDPRKRPTSASLLGWLAPELDVSTGHGFGPSPLPGPALRLIEEYRRGPAPSPAEAGAAGDATLGSVVSLRRPQAAAGPGGRREAGPGGRREAGPGGRREAGPGEPRPAGRGARLLRTGARQHRTGARPDGGRIRRVGRVTWTAAVAAAAAAVLVLGGTVLGTSIEGADSSDVQSQHPAFPPPGHPPAPGVPLSGLTGSRRGPPQIVLNQAFGDGNTVFVVHGSGWGPGQHITVRLTGGRTSRDTPVADMAGTFNYAIDQGHQFFPGGIPPGTYRVVVTAPGGAAAGAAFTVHP